MITPETMVLTCKGYKMAHQLKKGDELWSMTPEGAVYMCVVERIRTEIAKAVRLVYDLGGEDYTLTINRHNKLLNCGPVGGALIGKTHNAVQLERSGGVLFGTSLVPIRVHDLLSQIRYTPDYVYYRVESGQGAKPAVITNVELLDEMELIAVRTYMSRPIVASALVVSSNT